MTYLSSRETPRVDFMWIPGGVFMKWKAVFKCLFNQMINVSLGFTISFTPKTHPSPKNAIAEFTID